MKVYKNCFIGIPLPEEFNEHFLNILDSINNVIPELKTVNPSTPHITIYYLGTQEETLISDINDILHFEKDIVKNCNIDISGFDYFTHKNPKTIYLNVLPNQDIDNLYQKYCKRLKIYNQPDDRDFNPHLTIARIREKRIKNEFKNRIDKFDDLIGNLRWNFQLKEIVIYGRDFSIDDKGAKKLKIINI